MADLHPVAGDFSLVDTDPRSSRRSIRRRSQRGCTTATDSVATIECVGSDSPRDR
jgi:hypothetical protein